MVRFRQAVAGLLLFSGVVTATEPCAQVAEAQQKQLMEHPNSMSEMFGKNLEEALADSIYSDHIHCHCRTCPRLSYLSPFYKR